MCAQERAYLVFIDIALPFIFRCVVLAEDPEGGNEQASSQEEHCTTKAQSCYFMIVQVLQGRIGLWGHSLRLKGQQATERYMA